MEDDKPSLRTKLERRISDLEGAVRAALDYLGPEEEIPETHPGPCGLGDNLCDGNCMDAAYTADRNSLRRRLQKLLAAPYRIVRGDGIAHVTFPEYADAHRDAKHDLELQELVNTTPRVIFDLTHCKRVETSWARLIASLTVHGKTKEHFVAVRGANANNLLNTLDLLGSTNQVILLPEP